MAVHSRRDTATPTRAARRSETPTDSCISDVPGGCVIAVRVIPRAKRSAFDGQRESAGDEGPTWLVRLAAPPVDGAANDALIALFADTFGVPKRSIRIVSGERAREKRVRVAGLSAEEATTRLRT